MGHFYIRADANEKIGIGHMMRCLTIARELRRQKCEATFLVSDRRSAAVAADAGFGYYILNSDYSCLDEETERLLHVLQARDAKKLLVDSYYVTDSYLRNLRTQVLVAYLDDIDRFVYPCDLLINYNIYADQLHYPERYEKAGQQTRFALGPSYMPLRLEYTGIYEQREDCRRERSAHPEKGSLCHVLVTTGATDSLNIAGHLLDEVIRRGLNETCDFTCILGRYNPNRTALVREYGEAKNIHLTGPQKNLTDLIIHSDLAVTAGGTTVYELCAGGLPSVMLTLADNQLRAAKTFSEKGIIPYAGDVRTDMPGTMRHVADLLANYIEHPEETQATSEKMRHIVDGQGAARIAALLLE